MDTFELLPVLAAGDLSQTSAPELVAAIYRSRASGTLSLEGEGREEIRLFFRMGDSCGATRPAGFRSLGEILSSQQILTSDQVQRASSDASTSGKKLGEVLLDSRLLTQEQLHSALASQHRENLRLLLLRNVGGYEWRGWEPPPPWAAEVSVDPTRAILESLALPQLTGRRQAVLRWLADAQVRASLDFAELAGRAELVVTDRRAAELFSRPQTTEAYFRDSGLQRPRAEALLVTLLLLGGVEPVPPEAALPLDASSFEPRPPPAPLEFDLIEVAERPPPAQPPPPPLERPTPPPPPLERAVQPPPAPVQRALQPPPAPLQRATPPPPPLERMQPPPAPVQRAAPPPPAPLQRPAMPPAPAFARPRAPLEVEDIPFPLADQQGLFDPSPGFDLLEQSTGDEPLAEAGPRTLPPRLLSRAPEPDPLTLAAASAHGSQDVLEDSGEAYELEPIGAAPELVGVPEGEGVEMPDAAQDPGIFEHEMELVRSPHDDLGVDPFVVHDKARSGADSIDDHSGESAPLELNLPEPPPTLDDPREDPRAVRQRLLKVGMRNVGAFSQQQSIEGGEKAARELRTELAPEPPSAEDLAFLREVRERARAVPTQDAYARLGVPRKATQDQIRAAYLSLVKRFHPDKAQSGALQQALPDLEVLFGGLRDAYECIGSAEARAAYEESARTPTTEGGRRAPSAAEEAQLSLKKGEVHLKRRDYENAMRELRRAVDLDPSPEALTALAWALANDRSTGTQGREEALRLVARALKLDKDTARAHYVAGVLKRTTDADAALEHFRAAVNLDPRNGDAALELRLLERRREKKPITGPLSRLFKRDGK